MIAADRKHLQATLRADTLVIRDKELTIFSQNLATLATLSSFFTALSFTGFTMVPVWHNVIDDDEEENERRRALILGEVFFYLFISLSIGFNMLTLCISIWAMIFGPGLALRGPEGSMARAVDGMYVERKWALRSYGAGLVCLMIASTTLGWLKFGLRGDDNVHSRASAWSLSIVIGVFIIGMALYMRFAVR